MFPYFGRKGRHAGLYPQPLHPLIIEPFAGSMAWTLYHRPDAAIGIEADERVVALWHRLTSLERRPRKPKVGSKTNDLFVKLCSYSEHALTSGSMTVTSRMVRDWTPLMDRIMRDGPWAREHVRYIQGDYRSAPDVEATWFIDPPYQHANRRGYAMKGLDYGELADWCRSRSGQVIVCEQAGADWLPFKPLADFASHRGAKSAEVIWVA